MVNVQNKRIWKATREQEPRVGFSLIGGDAGGTEVPVVTHADTTERDL